jgi:hypothetical protein
VDVRFVYTYAILPAKKKSHLSVTTLFTDASYSPRVAGNTLFSRVCVCVCNRK